MSGDATGDERSESEYILGTDYDELWRLRSQHHAWIEQTYALWARAGLRAGAVVLDLGCGPGFTSFELAQVVGPDGAVIARDRSPRFLEFLRAERDRLCLPQIEPSLGPVEELDLPDGHLDAAYARWLLCWVEDPAAVLQRVAGRALKPGGAVVLQDYVDWGAMKLIPRSAVFDRAIEACMRSWEEGGGTIDIGEHVPELAAACGLRVEHFRPIARIGGVGSFEWRWLDGFFRGYLPKLVERGLFTADELESFLAEWNSRAARRDSRSGEDSYCYTPTMVDVILRKPL